MSKYWKQIERDVAALFGVRRTPLSGSNSGRTTADFVFGRTIYGEVKRELSISRALYPHLAVIGNGHWCFRVPDPRGTLIIFRLDSFIRAKRLSPAGHVFKNWVPITIRPNSVLRRIYWDSWRKAREEKFPCCLLVARVHDKEGLFAVANEPSVEVLKEWVRKYGRGTIARRSPSGMSSDTSAAPASS